MSTKNKMVVKIQGQEYKLMSEDSKEYMQGLATYVDEKMDELVIHNPKLTTTMVAVLTTLNMADDYFKLQKAYEALEQEQKPQHPDEAQLIDKIEAFQAELAKRDREYEHMIVKFEELMQSSSVYEDEMDGLKVKLNVLSQELRSKEQALDHSGHQIKRLEVEVDSLKYKKDTIELVE